MRWGSLVVVPPLVLALLAGAAAAGPRAVAPIGTKVVVGANPSALTIDRAGKVVYVTAAQITSARGSLVFVNAATRKVMRKVPVGANPEAVALSRSGARAFVANYDGNTVSVVGTHAGKVLRTVKVGQHPTSLVDVVVGGRELLFVANGGPVQPARGSLQVLAAANLRTVKTIRLPYNPSELAASRSGRTVYVGDTDAPRFGVVDAKALKLKRSVPLRGAAPVNALAVSRDGSRLYVATLASTVVLATRTLRQLAVIPADPPGDPLGIAVGPGGLALAVNGQGGASQPSPGTLTVIRGTRHVKSVGPLGYFAGDVALTPNARTTWVTNFGIRNGGYVLTFPTPRS